MMPESVLITDYKPTNQEIFSTYSILIIVPFLSFIFIQTLIIYRFIR